MHAAVTEDPAGHRDVILGGRGWIESGRPDATVAPSRAAARAMPAPRPEVPPLMSTTRSWSSLCGPLTCGASSGLLMSLLLSSGLTHHGLRGHLPAPAYRHAERGCR
jgi:hypothetical protein